MSETSPELRVGDRERRAVDERLLAAVADGVLTLHEYDERSAALWQARTRSELGGLVADLPQEPAPVAAHAPAPTGGRPRRVVAVMSEDRLSGAVAPGQLVEGYAVMGSAVVDLRREDLPDGVHVKVRALMGEVEVQVPPGSVVHLSGFSLMGDRKAGVAPAGGPEVHVEAVAVMGSVKVTVGDGSVVPRTPQRPGHGAGHGLGHPPQARSASGSTRLPAPHAGRRRGVLSRVTARGKALLVPAAVLAAVVLAGPDNVSIFGSGIERVASDDRNVQVSTLFGSTTVIVPDDSQVDVGGFLLFGSTDCDQACTSGEGPVVNVRTFGGFGSAKIVTRAEYEADQRDGDENDPVVELDEPED
jgi:hypothetical protein